MEPAISSDDSSDSEMKSIKNELSEFGLEEDNLSKEEMVDLLKALKNSKSTVQEDELLRQKVEDTSCSMSPKKSMRRRYLNVGDRRMPWSLLPSAITQAEKARTLAVYIKLMSINNYRQARQSANLISWPPPIQILEESTRIIPLRSTRSGRSVPVYAGFDDDSSDLDFVITKSKKRKVSSSDNNAANNSDTPAITPTTGKSLSLKRKQIKDDNARPTKEQKMGSECKSESGSTVNNKNIFSIIED